MKKLLYILLLFVASNTFATTVGPNDQYFLVHDFHDDWQVYNDRMKAYIPYISEQHIGYPSHTVFCDIQNNRGYNLLVYSQKDDNFLFINGSLRQKIPVGKWIVLSVDSLYRVYEQPTIYVTLYGSNNIEDKKLLLGYKRSLNQKPIVLAESGITAKPRTPAPYRNYIILTSVFILIVFSYLSNSYIRAFQRYFNPKDLFNTLVREQSFLINKPLNRTNVLFIILLSLIIGLFYMLLQSKGVQVFGARAILQEGDTLGILLSNYLRICLIVFVGLVVKYFFIGLIGQLFNLEKVVDLHYFKIIQASSLFYSSLVIVLLVLFMNYLPHNFDWQVYLFPPVVAFYVIRFFILYFTIIRSIPIQSLYLISYLCIVEILPVILGIRFAT
ncbi:hypothetical protein Emtol_1303 [Emticicia oligotrophica DSM 17448]|uniref:DUF4271 domain-containing protein n=1 Tax=Emticicia oligotrophica (strain DSM 17448 / CIP 109782 / MTCC 6937 / GPTSA100-15) TaxID=929562 RepID=A0ABN4AKW2_EMTOG|nr:MULTISPECIES: DUF4271 domain-containing protein [Emticicia]AFK02452.1 hypothetical protein Emtol_1303 [Emticicia oligotrophica DSM 17448]